MDPFIDGSELKDIVSIDDKNNARPITEETKAEAAVVCSHLILAYTVRLAIMNAVELERDDCCCFFFYLYWGNVVLWLKRTSKKSLQIELVTKYYTKDA